MNKEELIKLIDRGLSTYKIAKEFNCGQTNVRHWLKKFGLKTNVSKRLLLTTSNDGKCIRCGNPLSGYQLKYCSKICSNRHLNSWHNTAKRQKEKGIDKKIKLMKMLNQDGCSICGYYKNLSCLSFHHKNPKEKSFSLNQRYCSSRSVEQLVEEAKKCIVLCNNCHGELHHPQFNDWKKN